ncbi:ABC transporter substrate-binding protein [uncultured Tateyamaria sp.]|uniref:ABC transporter substrate-binding protein n=1 Tax=uncultured Tateyamaria sp. TaxID=455651 RepID=UPI0026173416|nr:ABC transporter substrate-binding protein [uncultured Tateyamaria sp.]
MSRTLLRPSRRAFVTAIGATPLTFALPTYLRAQSADLKIGVVAPLTGVLSPTITGIDHVFGRVQETLSAGIETASGIRTISLVVKDSQSSPNRASEVTSDLILNEEVDIIVTFMAPDTVNPVADQCELNEVPCISTLMPWQTFYYDRGATDEKGFDWTYHHFWGIDQVIDVFTDLWSQVDTNGNVGALWPSTGDGLAWANSETGFPPALAARNFNLTDPGRYRPLTDDFSQIISDFKANEVEIVTGVALPPDWTTFWTQAAQQGFEAKVASTGQALVFPASVEALGDLGNNHSFDLFWHPDFPFTSTITGQTAREFADDYMQSTERQWIQTMGSIHAVLEAAVRCLRDSDGTRSGTRDVLATLQMETIAGRIDTPAGPVKNVALTPLTGGQWRQVDGPHPYEPVIVSNIVNPEIPVTGEALPI